MDYSYNDKTSLKSWHPIVTKNFKELAAADGEISKRITAAQGDIDEHTDNASIHVTTADKNSWNTHKNNSDIHVTTAEKSNWNGHTSNADIHVTAAEKSNWNGHTSNADIHVTAAEKSNWNGHVNNSSIHFSEGEKAEFKRKLAAPIGVLNDYNITYDQGIANVSNKPDDIEPGTYLFTAPSDKAVDYIDIEDGAGEPVTSFPCSLGAGGTCIIVFNGISGRTLATLASDTDIDDIYDLLDIKAEYSDLDDCRNYYGVCETDADVNEKTVTIPNLSALTDGTAIKVRFSNGVYGSETEGEASGSVTLNVNGLGAKTVYFVADDTSDAYSGNECLICEDGVVSLVYNRNCWVVEGAYRVAASSCAYSLAGLTGNMLVPRFANSTANTATITNITTDLDNAYGTLTFLDMSNAVITPHMGKRRLISISFTSGATATNFVYPDGWLWKGDDCEDYVFVPQANMYYEMMIEYRNGVVTGYVAGFEVSADE